MADARAHAAAAHAEDLFLADLDQHHARITSTRIAPDFPAEVYQAAVWSEAAE